MYLITLYVVGLGTSKNMRTWLLAVSLFGWIINIHAEAGKEVKLSSYVDLCYRDDPKVAECIKKDIEKLLPVFKNGSEEFNLESLDPMYFDLLSFDYKSGIVGGKLNMTDVYVHGLSSPKVIEVRPNLNDSKVFKLAIDVHLPLMNLKTYYHLKGNLIKVPVDIKGRIDMIFESLNITYTITGNVKTVDDHEYLFIDKFTWNFFADGIHKAKISNKDIVYGKPALNQLLRTVVNSNWKPLVKQMLPVIIPESDKKLTSIFAKFFKSFPYDSIFPKNHKDDKTEDKDEDKKEDTEKDNDKKEDKDKKEEMEKDKDRKEEDKIKDENKKEDTENDKNKKEDMEKDKDKKEEIGKDKDKKEEIGKDKDKTGDMDKVKDEQENLDKEKDQKDKKEEKNNA